MVRHPTLSDGISSFRCRLYEAGRVMKCMVLYLHVYCIFSVFTLYLHLPFPRYAYFSCYGSSEQRPGRSDRGRQSASG